MENLAQDITINSENNELYSDDYPFRLPLRISSFEDEATFNKFIKNVETLVRRSNEYKYWRQYIIDVLGINTCMVTQERIDECTVEVHHHVPDLYTIVKAIVNKRLGEEEEFCSFDIATEVIEAHFQNKVGYLTLIKSMHEKYHNGCLNIPMHLVQGNYQEFLREYSRYLDQDDLDKIDFVMSIRTGNCEWESGNYPGIQEVSN